MRTPANAPRRLLPVLLLCLAAGCDEAATSASAAPSANVAAPPTPLGPAPDANDLDAMLDYKAEQYAQALLPDEHTTKGELSEGERRDLLAVLKGGHCYRVLGVGGAQVVDMDLFLFDPNGMQTHQDPGEDPYPVLGLQAAICPSTSGSYRVQVHMYKGAGPFAVRVYRTAQ